MYFTMIESPIGDLLVGGNGAAIALLYMEVRRWGPRIRKAGSATMRAVGAANGRNPISIMIPCHRVVGANGSLTGYGGGLEHKRWLLAHEARVRPRALSVPAPRRSIILSENGEHRQRGEA